MKIENKTIDIAKSETEKMKYSDLIKLEINTPINGGMTIAEMKTKMEIIALCDDGNLDFDETQIAEIKKMDSVMRWNILSKDIVEFSEMIQTL